MLDHIRAVRKNLLASEETICLQRAELITKSWRQNEAEPLPIRRAMSFAHVLENMDLDVQSNPFFAGNTSSRPRAWMLTEFHFNERSQIAVEKPQFVGMLDGKIPAGLREYWDGKVFGGAGCQGHLAVDLGRIVREGLGSFISDVEQHLDEGNKDQRVYREAMLIGLRAVYSWAQRYAEVATEAAVTETDPVLREAHLRVAEACRHVPVCPARNVFEALQSIAICHLASIIEGHTVSVSIGSPDRAMAHLIRDDLDTEETTALIVAFMLKLTANSVHGSATKTQAITVGGLDHQGRDQCNALTRCFLEATNIARVGDPHLFLRWHEDIAEDVKSRTIELLADGLSMPLLVHDVPTAQGFINAGVSPEDAWEYCVIGCSELGIPAIAQRCATASDGSIQYLGMLNRALLEHPDPAILRGMDDVMHLFETAMRNHLHQCRTRSEKNRDGALNCVPTPFTSALMRGCAQRGTDFSLGMDYHSPSLYDRGLTNAVNALAAIEILVFTERAISLTELIEAMRADFPDDAVRQRLLAAPKWGNDDSRVDRWAVELVEMRDRILDDIDREFGHPPHFVCHVVRSLHHTDGRDIAASPDGRYAGTPVCDSIGAQTGTAKNGPTGILNSVLKLDAARHYRGGYNLNITLSTSQTKPETLAPLVEAFFAGGGQELQINCLDANTLRAAQESPEKYGDIIVRFAGLSSRFVDLSPVEQQEIIARAENAPL